MQQRASRLSSVVLGVLAGLAGGIAIDGFLVCVQVLGSHAFTLTSFYQFVASGAIGKGTAYASPSYAWLGLAFHLTISAMWGVGYAYVAARTPQVAARPLLSGLAFGFVVYFAMQLVEVAAAIYSLPTPRSLGIALIAHMIFFGLPIAYVLRAAVPARAVA